MSILSFNALCLAASADQEARESRFRPLRMEGYGRRQNEEHRGQARLTMAASSQCAELHRRVAEALDAS